MVCFLKPVHKLGNCIEEIQEWSRPLDGRVNFITHRLIRLVQGNTHTKNRHTHIDTHTDTHTDAHTDTHTTIRTHTHKHKKKHLGTHLVCMLMDGRVETSGRHLWTVESIFIAG